MVTAKQPVIVNIIVGLNCIWNHLGGKAPGVCEGVARLDYLKRISSP